MLLIDDAINTMGSQAPRNVENSFDNGRNQLSSISLWTSVKDWWSVPSALQKPTENSVNSPSFASARQQNVEIEYALFRAILSPDIYIYPVVSDDVDLPQVEVSVDNRTPETTYIITVRFFDIHLPSASVPGASFIHEMELRNSSNLDIPQRHLVIIHGYMAAMGFFIKNVEAIARSYSNLVVHVLDLPGFGNSARPKFPRALLKLPIGASKSDEIAQILGVENWFIDKLEEWRIEKKITHFDLVGHSMGAYLSCCYLLKYNKPKMKIVDKFILISPMGTESSDISLINNTNLQFNHHNIASDSLEEIFASQDFENGNHAQENLTQLWEKLGKPRFPRNVVLKTIWNKHISPFQLLQTFGPLYSKLLSFWSFQRFKNLSINYSDEKKSEAQTNKNLMLKLHEYSYSIFNQYQASGELAITRLINHEIVSRIPLCDRGFVEYLNDSKIRTLWMYGDKDWMNTKGGEYCVEKLNKLSDPAAEFLTLENAGHHLYLDNPEKFNDSVIEFFGYHNTTRS